MPTTPITTVEAVTCHNLKITTRLGEYVEEQWVSVQCDHQTGGNTPAAPVDS